MFDYIKQINYVLFFIVLLYTLLYIILGTVCLYVYLSVSSVTHVHIHNTQNISKQQIFNSTPKSYTKVIIQNANSLLWLSSQTVIDYFLLALDLGEYSINLGSFIYWQKQLCIVIKG